MVILNCFGLFISASLFYVLHKVYKEYMLIKRMPPFWFYKHIPLIGSLAAFSWKQEELAFTADEQFKKLGPIFSMKYFGMFVVFTGKFDIMKRMFVNNANFASGRMRLPDFSFVEKKFLPSSGIATGSGLKWRLHKRLVTNTMTHLGYKSQTFEAQVLNEADTLIKSLYETGQSPVYPYYYFANAVCNMLCLLCFGRTFDVNDPRFHQLCTASEDLLSGGFQTDIQYVYPFEWMAWFPFLKKERVCRKLRGFQEFANFINNEIEHHITNGLEDNNILDSMLSAQSDSKITNPDIRAVIRDLIIAGLDTSTVALLWTAKTLMVLPDVQEKVYAEIKTHLKDEQLSFSDRGKLHYTNAVLHEILRYGCLVPMLIPHVAENTFKIDNFIIPKGAMIFHNIWTVTRDPEAFKNPFDFDPNNFLDENGHFEAHKELTVFGIGQRSCVGERMANMEYFFIFVKMVTNFRLTAPPGKSYSIEDGNLGMTRAPTEFEVMFIPR